MDAKVPELLDLTRKLLDQAADIFHDSLPSISVPVKEGLYSIFLCVQMSEALKFGYGAYHSCNQGWGHGGIGAARSIYEIFLDIKYINNDEVRKDERFERFVDHLAEARYDQMKRNLGIGKDIPKEHDIGLNMTTSSEKRSTKISTSRTSNLENQKWTQRLSTTDTTGQE